MTPRRSFDWTAASLCVLVLVVIGGLTSWPSLPRELRLSLVLPAADVGRTEPLIVTGERQNGDLLVIKYLDANHAAFVYDCWGAGGPVSAPFEYTAGVPVRVGVVMPALTQILGTSINNTQRLRLTANNSVVLDTLVPFHERQPENLFFGVNAIEGSTAHSFRGTIYAENGPELRGGISTLFSPVQRFGAFLLSPRRLLGVLMLGSIAGLLIARLRSMFHPSFDGLNDASDNGRHVSFWLTASVAGLLFAAVVTGGSFHLIYPDWFGSFYDYQANALLHGRLDVPEKGISGEAFVFGGKYYGYFGPTPALMRIPVTLLGIGFGELTRIFLIFDYGACLLALYFILRQATRLLNGRGARPSNWAIVVWVGGLGLGSTTFFLGSRAYVYHEAILCGAAFALWASYCTLRYLEISESRWWIGALVCGLLAVHARPPIGLYSLTFLGAVSLAHACEQTIRQGMRNAWSRVARRYLPVLVLALLAILSFSGLSYLKFHTIDGCPLRYNVQYTPARLARIDGKQFHLGNVPFGFDAYFLAPSLRVSSGFPYFQIGRMNRRYYAGAKLDLVEPTVAIPYAMPALFFVAVLSLAMGVRAPVTARIAIIAAWLSAIPVAIAMFAAIAVSHRYTMDFAPFLMTAGAFGQASIDPGGRFGSRVLRVVIAGLTLLSIAITLAFTLEHQAESFGAPPATRAQYQTLRDHVNRFFGVERP